LGVAFGAAVVDADADKRDELRDKGGVTEAR
jgi:hypothetical protein